MCHEICRGSRTSGASIDCATTVRHCARSASLGVCRLDSLAAAALSLLRAAQVAGTTLCFVHMRLPSGDGEGRCRDRNAAVRGVLSGLGIGDP